MHDVMRIELEKWGLPAAEARAYLTLLRTGSLSASSIAKAIQVPRTSVYPILESLLQKGLVETGAALGSRYTAVRPKDALPAIIVREREELVARDRLTGNLIKQLDSLAEFAEVTAETELIQVLKDPRVVAERAERLLVEVEQQIQVFCKPPVIVRGNNSAQLEALRRGVRVRALYERAYLDLEIVESNLGRWTSSGEEARVYDGVLPHKLAIFDSQSILMPLITPTGQGKTLFVRNPQLAASLGMLFEYIWRESKPIASSTSKKPARAAKCKSQKQEESPGTDSNDNRASEAAATAVAQSSSRSRNGAHGKKSSR